MRKYVKRDRDPKDKRQMAIYLPKSLILWLRDRKATDNNFIICDYVENAIIEKRERELIEKYNHFNS